MTQDLQKVTAKAVQAADAVRKEGRKRRHHQRLRAEADADNDDLESPGAEKETDWVKRVQASGGAGLEFDL